MKKTLGIVGETGSGKDAFCQVAKKLFPSVFCFRFSDPLTETLKIFFDDIKKEDQQWLGIVLRKRFGNDILGKAIEKKIKRIRKGWIFLNGVRVWEEYGIIKNLGGKIIYITAAPKIRWQRIGKRGEKKDDLISYQKFLKMEKAKIEIFISKIGRKADFKIENNGSRKLFNQEIRKIIDKLKDEH